MIQSDLHLTLIIWLDDVLNGNFLDGAHQDARAASLVLVHMHHLIVPHIHHHMCIGHHAGHRVAAGGLCITVYH